MNLKVMGQLPMCIVKFSCKFGAMVTSQHGNASTLDALLEFWKPSKFLDQIGNTSSECNTNRKQEFFNFRKNGRGKC